MKILILKTSSLGDIIQTFPVLSYLKERFQNGELHWVVEKPFFEFVESHPLIDKVFQVDTKKWRKSFFSRQVRDEIKKFESEIQKNHYDYVFDLQSNLKSSLILLKIHAKQKIGFGWKTAHEKLSCFFTKTHVDPPKGKNIREDYMGVVQGFFKDERAFKAPPITLRISKEKENALHPFVSSYPTLICPGAAWPNKRLSFEALNHLLKKIGPPFLFAWGSVVEKELCEKLKGLFPESQLLPYLSIAELQYVMAKSKRVVAMDSLPLHLCAMTPTPTLSFFGPSLAQKFRPQGSHHIAIQGKCPYNVTFEKRCPHLRTCPTGACIMNAGMKCHTK